MMMIMNLKTQAYIHITNQQSIHIEQIKQEYKIYHQAYQYYRQNERQEKIINKTVRQLHHPNTLTIQTGKLVNRKPSYLRDHQPHSKATVT